MADDTVQVSIEVVDKLTQGLNDAAAKLQQFAEQASRHSEKVKESTDSMTQAFQKANEQTVEMVIHLAELVGAFELLRGAVEGLKERIDFADKFRDVSMSMDMLERSAGAGQVAFKKFSDQATTTRNTTLELADAFAGALPAAMRRGISDATLSDMTIQLAKIAPALNQSLETTMQQWEQIMAGRVRKTSPLANLLLAGSDFKIEDLVSGKDAVPIFDAMKTKMDELADKASVLGQSFASTAKQIKDAFFEAFAAGFNSLNDQTQKGYEGLIKAFDNPDVLRGITALGKAIAGLVPIITSVVSALPDLLLGLGGASNLWKLLLPTGSPVAGPPGTDASQQRIDMLRGLRGLRPGDSGMGSGFYQDPSIPRLTYGGPAPPPGDDIQTFGPKAKDYQKALEELYAVQEKIKKEFSEPFPDALSNKLVGIQEKADAARAELVKLAEAATKAKEPAIAEGYDKLRASVQGLADAEAQAVINNDFVKYFEKADDAAAKLILKIQEVSDKARAAIAGLPGAAAGTDQIGANEAVAIAQINALRPLLGAAGIGTEVAGQIVKGLEGADKPLVEAADKAGKALQEASKKAAAEFTKIVVDTLANALADVGTTGGKNFGSIIGKSFLDEVNAGAKDIFKALLGSGGQVSEVRDTAGNVTGYRSGSGQLFPTLNQAQQATTGAAGGTSLGDALRVGLAGAGAFANSFNQTGQSDLSAAIGGLTAAVGILAASATATVAGGAAGLGAVISGEASIPVVGWIAAVVTVVAAVVGKLLQPSPGSGYQYGTGIGITAGGEATGAFNMNVDVNTQKKWLGMMQDQFDIFYNGYMGILLKLPHDILPKISEAFNAVYGRFEQGADLGLAASEKFGTELQNYFSVGLPHQIADRFSVAIRAGFEAVGFSESAFNAIWKQLSALDPQKALQFLQTLADAALEINKAMDYLSKPTGFGTTGDPYAYMSTGGGGTMMLSEPSKNFADQMSIANAKLLEMANNIQFIVGPDKITAWKSLGDALTQATDAEAKFVAQLQQAIASEAKSWQSLISGFQLGQMVDAQGKPDIAKQVDFLKKQADTTFAALSTATDVGTVQGLSADLQKLIQQIVQLGGSVSPQSQQAYLKWGEAAAQQAQDAVIQRLKDLGAQLDQVNKDFLAKFQPLWDAYSKQLGDGSTSVNNFNNNLDTASGGVKDFTEALSKATAVLDGSSSSGDQSGSIDTTSSWVNSTSARRAAAGR